jgi:site-specific recombinase XerD
MSPHKCRHTFATYMLRSGADIRYVQTLLGHSTIKTTEIYTEVDVDDLKANVAKLKY